VLAERQRVGWGAVALAVGLFMAVMTVAPGARAATAGGRVSGIVREAAGAGGEPEGFDAGNHSSATRWSGGAWTAGTRTG
jgi:hypothetical protein